MLLTISTMANVQASRLTVTLFALSLGAPALIVGILAALYSVLAIVFSVPIGRWIDRVGTRPPLMLSASAAIVGNLLPVAFPSLGGLALSAGVIGLAFVLMFIAANVLVPQLGPVEDRMVNYAWYSLSGSAGFAIGSLISGFGVEHIGHRGTFLVLIGLPLLTLVGIAVGWRLFPPAMPQVARTTARLRDVVRERKVRLPLLGSAVAPVSAELYYFVVPLFATGIGIGASTIGIILSSCSGVALGTRAVLPFLLKRLPPAAMVAGTFMMTGVVFFVLPHTSSVPLLILLSIVTGFSTGISAPIVVSLLYGTLPAGRQAEVIGVRSVLMNGGQIVAPTAVGGLSTVLGLAPVLALVGGGVMLFGWLFRKQGREGAAPRS